MTTINRVGVRPALPGSVEAGGAIQGRAEAARPKARNSVAANRQRDSYARAPVVYEKQHFKIRQNKHKKPEDYDPALRKQLFKTLSTKGVVFPPIEDEAHVNGKVRTTYASVDKKTGVLVVGLDNAAYHSKGYEGLSKGERRFARHMAEYGQRHGLTTIVMSHIPPTQKSKFKLPNEKEKAALRKWQNGLREKFPDTLFVHGHQHKNKAIDLDAKNGKNEVSNLVMAGQAKKNITKITTYKHGRRIEHFEVVGGGAKPRLKRTSNIVLSRTGERVNPAKHKLGKAKGVLYGISDLHKDKTLPAYFRALRADAKRTQKHGLPVSYLDLGDHTVHRAHITTSLPQGGRYYWAPGNHDYYNHASLEQTVNFFSKPRGKRIPTRVDYKK